MAEQPLSLTVTLETVTPLFLGGADPSGAPELRPPSFRGALRYWLRAALGGVIGDNLEALKRAEAEVFGSTERASKIGVRVAPFSLPLTEKPDGMLRVKGMERGQSFRLTLASRNAGDAEWKCAIASLLLLVSFGGAGRRTRRIAGTLRLLDADVRYAKLDEQWSRMLTAPYPDTADEWGEHLDAVMRGARAATRDLCLALGLSPASMPVPNLYPALTKETKWLVFAQIFDNPESALNAFTAKRKRAGIPDGALGRIGPRHASPLWLRALPVGERYVLSALFFRTTFPPGSRSNYPAVERFLSDLAKEWRVVEVKQ